MKKLFYTLTLSLLSLGQLMATDGQVLPLNIEKIKQPFFAQAVVNLNPTPVTAILGSKPIYTCFYRSGFTVETAQWAYPDIPFYLVYDNGQKERAKQREVNGSILGVFLTHLNTTSANHIATESWLYSFTFDGHKIDSLCIFRSFNVENETGVHSDYVSQINPDLSVNIVYIQPTREHFDAYPNQMNKLGATFPVLFMGKRHEVSYKLNKTGHFTKVGETVGAERSYIIQDFEFTSESSIALIE